MDAFLPPRISDRTRSRKRETTRNDIQAALYLRKAHNEAREEKQKRRWIKSEESSNEFERKAGFDNGTGRLESIEIFGRRAKLAQKNRISAMED